MKFSEQRTSLLSSQARIQAPWVKVTIGDYSFGVFSKSAKEQIKDSQGFYTAYRIKYPNYIQSLQVTKINGQVNTYELHITYPVRSMDDPNFFEKVFSSVSSSRKIIFSYGDSAMPTYVYKDEEAIITKVQQTFNLTSSTISYIIYATSGAALGTTSCHTFTYQGLQRPSTLIKDIFKNQVYGLQSLFTGMKVNDLDNLIRSDDTAVEITPQTNISALDYIKYLVGCMIPAGQTTDNISKDVYILTVHDDTVYDASYNESKSYGGPYFEVTRISHQVEQSDAYTIDIGYNTSTIVSGFNLENNENYSLMYDYQTKLDDNDGYVRRLNNRGEWVDVYAPSISSRNKEYSTQPEDITWWTKVTQYPVKANITIQGLLRPAVLMSYVRLNVIFPGGHKHISSGLYMITKQVDTIDANGYKTQLSMTKIAGDSTTQNSLSGSSELSLYNN